MIKPYPQHNLEIGQLVYNYRISRARRMIECVFGMLTKTFCILKTEIQFAPEESDILVWAIVYLYFFVKEEGRKYLRDTPSDSTFPQTSTYVLDGINSGPNHIITGNAKKIPGNSH